MKLLFMLEEPLRSVRDQMAAAAREIVLHNIIRQSAPWQMENWCHAYFGGGLMPEWEWYEVTEGDHYRHKLTGTTVRVADVDNDAGFSGAVRWESLGGRSIDGQTSAVQETQHFLEDFDPLKTVSRIAA